MSSYFDAITREIRTISSMTRDDTPTFLKELMRIEEHMKDDCLQLAGDRETPLEVREKIMEVIALNEVRYAGGDFLGDDKGPSDGANMAAVSRTSRLVSAMHSLFHDIALLRIKTRYGVIMDNPAAAVRARNIHDAETNS